MRKDLHTVKKMVRTTSILAIAALGTSLFFSALIVSTPGKCHGITPEISSQTVHSQGIPLYSKNNARNSKRIYAQRRGDGGMSPQLQENWRAYQLLSPKERARVEKKFKTWQSFPSQKQGVLRNRWEQWRKLPTKDQTLFRRRFNQWQGLSPQERKKIHKQLKTWEQLSPETQESLRRKFLPR